MKLSVKTPIMKELVSRAIKGASQNKLIPLTGLMAIQLKDGKLTLLTTDASNYLYVMQDNVAGDEFYVTVQVEQFSKLISKMTCDMLTLELNDAVLSVKGNGDYKIELPLDETGELIKFPSPMDNETTEGIDISLATIKTILNSIKPSLAVTMEVPVYTRYYFGDRVIGTDSEKMASMNKNVLQIEPVLISQETVNLLDVMTCETIQFHKNDSKLIFASLDCIVYGNIMDGVDDYPVEPIMELVEEKFESSCKLDRNALLSILDRISLFVGQYDNKCITLTFAEEGVNVSSKKSTGIEMLKYLESENFKPFTCSVDILVFTQQLKGSTSDTIQLEYGNDNTLKWVDNDITQVMALFDDEE